MGQWKYSSTIVDLGTRWKCVQLHALAALSPGKEPPAPIGYEAGWAPEPVWTLWREEKSCTIENRTRVIKPVVRRYTLLIQLIINIRP
jgi:hypothetical protein